MPAKLLFSLPAISLPGPSSQPPSSQSPTSPPCSLTSVPPHQATCPSPAPLVSRPRRSALSAPSPDPPPCPRSCSLAPSGSSPPRAPPCPEPAQTPASTATSSRMPSHSLPYRRSPSLRFVFSQSPCTHKRAHADFALCPLSASFIQAIECRRAFTAPNPHPHSQPNSQTSCSCQSSRPPTLA